MPLSWIAPQPQGRPVEPPTKYFEDDRFDTMLDSLTIPPDRRYGVTRPGHSTYPASDSDAIDSDNTSSGPLRHAWQVVYEQLGDRASGRRIPPRQRDPIRALASLPDASFNLLLGRLAAETNGWVLEDAVGVIERRYQHHFDALLQQLQATRSEQLKELLLRGLEFTDASPPREDWSTVEEVLSAVVSSGRSSTREFAYRAALRLPEDRGRRFLTAALEHEPDGDLREELEFLRSRLSSERR